ncbi:MAG: hypothetical protein LAT58_14130 [Opitutales bacterium]|nr:hypothetical protein [Opitutales bacterium]
MKKHIKIIPWVILALGVLFIALSFFLYNHAYRELHLKNNHRNYYLDFLSELRDEMTNNETFVLLVKSDRPGILEYVEVDESQIIVYGLSDVRSYSDVFLEFLFSFTMVFTDAINHKWHSFSESEGLEFKSLIIEKFQKNESNFIGPFYKELYTKLLVNWKGVSATEE